jgi:hypothetical protein
MEEVITIYLEDVYPFVKKKDAQRIVLRFLHERGIEGDIGSDESGPYIRYYRPADDVFEDFSKSLYKFITNGGK